jgi:hypothetical protein
MTPEEQKFFSYFEHHTVPSPTGFFNSTLWQHLVPRVSRTEHGVYHAVIMLSAVHQNAEAQGM